MKILIYRPKYYYVSYQYSRNNDDNGFGACTFLCKKYRNIDEIRRWINRKNNCDAMILNMVKITKKEFDVWNNAREKENIK
jgi:hypothetical protein